MDPSQNALKHACRSKAVIVRGESEEDYNCLWETWLTRYTPRNPAEVELLRMVVDAAWRMQRSERVLNQYETKLFAAKPDPDEWTDDQLRRLALFQRYKTADTNAFQKALRLIEHLDKIEVQSEAATDHRAERALKDLRLGKQHVEVKGQLWKEITKSPELPSHRNDGGCACPPCLLEWAVREYKRGQQNEAK